MEIKCLNSIFNVIKFLSLAAVEVVNLTTYNEARDKNYKGLNFQFSSQ